MQPDGYVVDEEHFPPFENRTRLFNLVPIGLGTPDCESLTSYMVRLARTHSLPMRRFISRYLFADSPAAKPLCDAKFFREYAATVNGLGRYAEKFVAILNAATGRTDLDQLTFRPWSQLLPSNGSAITFPRRRWCPVCVADFEKADGTSRLGDEPHWPLAWSIVAATTCRTHRVVLVDRCPHCLAAQPSIPCRPSLTRCDRCSLPLACSAMAPQTAASTAESGLDERGSVAAEMIRAGGLVHPGRTHAQWTAAVVAAVRDSGSDRATACRGIGLNPRALNAWINRGEKPSLDAFITVCLGLGLCPARVFCSAPNDSSAVGYRKEVVKPSTQRIRHSIDTRIRAGVLLDDAVTAEVIPTLKEIASSMGVSNGFLRYWYPSKVESLARRRSAALNEARLLRLRRVREEINNTVTTMYAAGIYPGRKRTENEVRAKGFSLIDEVNHHNYLDAMKRFPSVATQ